MAVGPFIQANSEWGHTVVFFIFTLNKELRKRM